MAKKILIVSSKVSSMLWLLRMWMGWAGKTTHLIDLWNREQGSVGKRSQSYLITTLKQTIYIKHTLDQLNEQPGPAWTQDKTILTQLFFFFFLASCSFRLPALEWLVMLFRLEMLSDEFWRSICSSEGKTNQCSFSTLPSSLKTHKLNNFLCMKTNKRKNKKMPCAWKWKNLKTTKNLWVLCRGHWGPLEWWTGLLCSWTLGLLWFLLGPLAQNPEMISQRYTGMLKV